MIYEYLERLRSDPLECLRWYVALALGIAPYSQSDEEVVKCGLHLLGEHAASAPEDNPYFDETQFVAMKEGRYGA